MFTRTLGQSADTRDCRRRELHIQCKTTGRRPRSTPHSARPGGPSRDSMSMANRIWAGRGPDGLGTRRGSPPREKLLTIHLAPQRKVLSSCQPARTKMALPQEKAKATRRTINKMRHLSAPAPSAWSPGPRQRSPMAQVFKMTPTPSFSRQRHRLEAPPRPLWIPSTQGGRVSPIWTQGGKVSPIWTQGGKVSPILRSVRSTSTLHLWRAPGPAASPKPQPLPSREGEVMEEHPRPQGLEEQARGARGDQQEFH
jgi:hypothetical protein